MDTILVALADQHAELDGLISGLDEAGWNTPSACAGWSISDVVLHLAQTDEMGDASARGDFGPVVARFTEGLGGGGTVDDIVGRIVERERGDPGAAVYARWQTASTAVRAALAACDPHTRVQWVAGQLSARTLATTRMTEAWIHTGDVARGLSVTLPATDRLGEIARLAWRTLPYAFGRAGRELAGPVAFELLGPNGDTWTFAGDEPAVTTIYGEALELCLVAGQRLDPAATALKGEGPDAAAVLELVRTFA